MFSKSAKALAKMLPCKRIIPGGRYQAPRSVTVVNWGSSKPYAAQNILNRPSAVQVATNKLSAFAAMDRSNVATVDHTASPEKAKSWQTEGFRVVARTILTGHSGKGIIIVQPEENLPYAPLYTKYHKKTTEFRIHVFKGKVIDVSEKRKRSGMEITNSLVRTLNNGWVYCRNNVTVGDSAKVLATSAVHSLGLDFGAVDIIFSKEKYLVLEVNTAPGIENSTLQKYAEAIRGLYV